MQKPLLIASDLDGTLVPTNQIMTAFSQAVIDDVQQAGSQFMVATGRPPSRAKRVYDQINHCGVAVCTNGAILLDTKTFTPIYSESLPLQGMVELVNEWKQAVPDLHVYVEHFEGQSMEPTFNTDLADYMSRFFKINYAATLEAMFDEPVYKMVLVREEGRSILEIAETIAKIAGSQVTVTSSHEQFLEVSQAGVSKKTGVAKYCEIHDIDPQDVMSFGDMPNDLELMVWAGHGVAMDNAIDEVKAKADGIAGLPDEDGVANYLAKHVLGRSL